MNSPALHIRRILVALDSSAPTPARLEVATELARRLSAELEGLFVEDDELLRLAALPFTTQVNLSTGGRQPLDRTELESQMTRLAAKAQRQLATVAERDRVAWSFRTVRGRIAHEVASAAEGADLVIVEGGHHGGPAHARLGLPASATVKSVTRSVLILRDGRRVEGRIFVVYSGTAQSEKALRMAAILAPDIKALTVLLSDKAGHDPKDLEARVHELLGNSADSAAFEKLSADTLKGLCAQTSASDTGMIVLGADSPLLSAGDIAGLLDSITCTVLLVR